MKLFKLTQLRIFYASYFWKPLSNALKIDTVQEISLIDIFDISGIHET